MTNNQYKVFTQQNAANRIAAGTSIIFGEINFQNCLSFIVDKGLDKDYNIQPERLAAMAVQMERVYNG